MSDLYINNKKVIGIKPPGSDTIIPLKGKKISGFNAVLQTTQLATDQFNQSANNGNRYPAVKAITLKEGTERIPARCFMNLDSIKSVVIPGSVTSIRENAFSGCISLTDVYFEGDTPPTLENSSFYGLTLTIHYPAGSSTWETEALHNTNEYAGATVTWEAD
jgi:hypothetical protein